MTAFSGQAGATGTLYSGDCRDRPARSEPQILRERVAGVLGELNGAHVRRF